MCALYYLSVIIYQPIFVRRSFVLSIANLHLVQANFSFLFLNCLKFILIYVFLSYFGILNRLSFILNWLFSVSRQQSVGAASLAVIITQFYAGKLDLFHRHDLAFGTDAVIAVERRS